MGCPLDRWAHGGFGDLEATPQTLASVQPIYQRTAGDIELDLRQLDLAVPQGGDASPVRTRIEVGAGDVEVTVPRDADVTLTSNVGIGEISFEDRHLSDGDLRLPVTDLGADGVASGRRIILDVQQGVGNLEVHRG